MPEASSPCDHVAGGVCTCVRRLGALLVVAVLADGCIGSLFGTRAVSAAEFDA